MPATKAVDFRQILETVEALAGMRHEDGRIDLEHAGDRHDRHILLHGFQHLDRIRAHDEIDASRRQQDLRVHLRAALQNFHVEAVARISPVGDRLIETAMFGLCAPVGGEGHLVGGESRQGREKGEGGRKKSAEHQRRRSILARAAYTKFRLRRRWISRRNGISPRASGAPPPLRRRLPRARCAGSAPARRSCRRGRQGAD